MINFKKLQENVDKKSILIIILIMYHIESCILHDFEYLIIIFF
jgi:hypothetical protein